MFIGTNRGLYRLNLGVWDQLPVDPLKTVHSMAVFENNLYVVTGPDILSRNLWNQTHRTKCLARFSTQPTQDLRGAK